MSNKQEPNDTLPPSSEEQGGLLTVPKERHVFKAPAPKASLLGLDRLAAQKRAEQGSILGTSPWFNVLLYLVTFSYAYNSNDSSYNSLCRQEINSLFT